MTLRHLSNTVNSVLRTPQYLPLLKNCKLPLPLAGASISYTVVTVTTHTNKVTYSDTLTILKPPAAATESVFL